MARSQPLIIIIGAGGNIGQALTKALQQVYHVVTFDRDCQESCIEMDLGSKASIQLALKTFKERYPNTKIAAVIHLAAYFDFTGEPSPLYDKVNVQGTKHLLIALQKFEVERFIYPSTMLVHKATGPGGVVSENSKIEPKWIYPQSKYEAEKVIEKYHVKIPYLILRLAGLYDEETAVPSLTHQIARVYERDFKSHFYAGDLDAGQSLIHREDLIALFEKAIKFRNQLPEEEIIIAGEPEAISYQDMQNLIGKLIHGEEEWNIINLPKPVAKAGAWLEDKAEAVIPDDIDQGEKPFIKPFMIDISSDHYALDISKAKEKLHWQPKHRIEKALPAIIESLKKNPLKWYKKNKVTPPNWLSATKSKATEEIRKNYERKIRYEHQQNIWARFFTIAFGLWLITSPFIFGFQNNTLHVLSEVTSGILVVIFGFIALSWRFAVFRWVCALIGIWLLFAPLILWTQSPAGYLNDTLVGSLIIGFSVLLPPEIGIAPNAMLTGPDIPSGWEFSPSSWFQRLPIIALAFIGLFISLYLAAYQLGYIKEVWDPFFKGSMANPKNGTEEIITSHVSKVWPISDAGLGAITYLLEILTGMLGRVNRWRTMPWLVILFGFMIVPLGAVSITFIIIQPILLGTWCTLCLIAAIAMILQIPYSFDELIATFHFLARRKKMKRPLLHILFVGDTDETEKKERDSFEETPKKIIKKMVSGGISFPWTLNVSILIGIGLMLTPLFIGLAHPMANVNHLIGALVITISVTAWAEVIRPIRLLNIALAFGFIICAFIYSSTFLMVAMSVFSGLALILLSIPKGKIYSQYGDWDRYIF